jgi:2-haloacid dehalogenase
MERADRGRAMTISLFADIGACVFDAYGTVFDLASATRRCDASLGGKAEALSALWRIKQLDYTWLRSLMGRHAEFWQVTGEALDYALAALDLHDEGLHARLMDGFLTCDAYADARPALAAVKRAGLPAAILSNGSPAMLAAAIGAAGIGELLDHCLSVEEVGVYKPDPRVYALAERRLGLARERICFVSSNGWDAAGATAYGFRSVWVNRAGAPRERLPPPPDAELSGLDRLAELLGW